MKRFVSRYVIFKMAFKKIAQSSGFCVSIIISNRNKNAAILDFHVPPHGILTIVFALVFALLYYYPRFCDTENEQWASGVFNQRLL